MKITCINSQKGGKNAVEMVRNEDLQTCFRVFRISKEQYLGIL